ncbi:MAG: thiamine pyrophosphate-binding protein [Actinomycetota bacterium]|nr:thiamine pyrophosphate-binding protein [Actinomycetota bacterium]
MTGAELLCEALLRMGAQRIYGIIGTSNIAFIDALCQHRKEIRYISCRHEQVACSMADAEGRLTGKPGVAIVHSGPGALNGTISAGNAWKDCSPMIVITGAVKRKLAGSDGMLEINHRKVYEPISKATFRAESANSLLFIFGKAYRESMSFARGPVLIEVPEDVWTETTDVDPSCLELIVDEPPEAKPNKIKEAVEILKEAKLPLLVSGGGVAYSNASHLLVDFAESLDIPVITTGNGRGTIPETHPLCFGRAGFGGGTIVADKALEKADAVLCLGCYLSDMTTYEFTLPIGQKKIIAVNVSKAAIAPPAPKPTMFVQADALDFLKRALETIEPDGSKIDAWNREISEARSQWEMLKNVCLEDKGNFASAALLMNAIDENLKEEPIVSVGAGTHLLYPMAFLPCRKPLTFLSTVNFGSMGFGLAAAMAAKLVYPEKPAIAILGDGDFMMTIQDLETAVREKIAIKVFVINDFSYRVLNLRQKAQFQGRIYGTTHGNPDFASLARSFGATGYRVDNNQVLKDITSKILEEEGPTVVDVIIDPDNPPPMNVEATLKMSGTI